jgi:hypothetical protein
MSRIFRSGKKLRGPFRSREQFERLPVKIDPSALGLCPGGAGRQQGRSTEWQDEQGGDASKDHGIEELFLPVQYWINCDSVKAEDTE